MATDYEQKRIEAIAAESAYARAAAEWVAAFNRTPESGVTQIVGSDGEPNVMTLSDHITAVTFKMVGAYHYSEETYDHGGAGLEYLLWPTHGRRKPFKMEHRWDEEYSAGRFIEECVALLTAKEGS